MKNELRYWTSVFKRIILLSFAIGLTILLFKIAIFYMPFLIAFIISLIIEPLIRKLMKNFKITRKLSSIIVFMFTFGIIIGLFTWGILTLISESSNLLSDFNNYYNNIYNQIQNILDSFNSLKLKFSKELIDIIFCTRKCLELFSRIFNKNSRRNKIYSMYYDICRCNHTCFIFYLYR